MKECKHQRTQIWEPHLAGARKCLDCNMVYNPNHTPSWFTEPPPLEDQIKHLRADVERLTKARDAYAAAMTVALKSGIFFNKRSTMDQIAQLVEGHQ